MGISTFALARPFRGERAQRRLTETGISLAVAAAAASSTWFIDHWGTRRGLAMGLFVLALAWLATTRRTLVALAVLMLYLGCVDGYAKLSTGSTAVSLVRDALLFAIVAGVLVRGQGSAQPMKLPPLSLWVIGFVVLVLVQLLNPNDGTLVHSLGGVRQHLEFVPLFFLAFAFVRSKAALRGFVILLLVIGAANGVAGYIQFGLTQQQFAAWGPGYAERVLATGRFVDAGRTFAATEDVNRVRPFGLGSDAGAGGVMGAFALGALLAMIARGRRLRYLLLAAALATFVVTAIVTSQGRGAVVSAAIILIAYGGFTIAAGGRLVALLSIGATALVAVAVFQGVLSSTGSSGGAGDTFRYSGLASSRIVQTTTVARGGSFEAIPENLVKYPFGAGLAVAGPASGAPGGTPLSGTIDAESWFSFMVVEAGIGGMLVVTGFTVMLLWLGLTRIRFEPDAETRTLLAAIVAPIAAMLALYVVGGGVTATTPYAPYLWAVGGIASYWLIVRPRELAAARVSA
ncbi:MAG TPA: hypothetical protein VI300_07480 [Solirubrobacter sp.]